MGTNILTSDMNNLYNPIFCNLLFNTNNGFLQYKNANFGPDFTYDTSKQSYYVSNNISNENACLNECNTIDWCTSYKYDLKNKVCTKYSEFPSIIVNNVDGVNCGYNINKQFDYNNLTEGEKTNVKKRCFNQYLNNVYTPNNIDIDLNSCLSSFSNDSNTNTTIVNFDKECLFNAYNSSNAVNLKSSTISNYIDDPQFTNSVADPNITNYKSLYDKYNANKETINNINNTLSQDDVPINNNLYNNYINEINIKKDKMNESSNKIINRSSNENFENQNINYIKIIIFLIVFFILLFLIVYIICKL